MLEAARKVLRYAPESGRYWLSVLSNTKHPEFVKGEDDLVVFYDDPEFRTLVGPAPYLRTSPMSSES